MNEIPEVMTMDEVCAYLRASRPNLKKMIKDGLPFFTLTGSKDSHKRFNKTDVDIFKSERSKS